MGKSMAVVVANIDWWFQFLKRQSGFQDLK